MSIREQQDAAEELAALRDDRDRWQTRAKQAEGKVATLTQEWQTAQRYVSDCNEVNNRLTTQVSTLQCGVDHLQQQLTTTQIQLREATQQLEAAAHSPDLRGDLERVAAERDAAREEVRGLQVRAEQVEGDARQASAKLRHIERESARWEAYAQEKNNLLLKSEGAANALQLVILNIVREVSNHDD